MYSYNYEILLKDLKVKSINVDVMVNFMCQLHWALGCPDSWSNVTLGVFVGVSLYEINI